MVSKYFSVLLINKTKFPNPCHAVKNSAAVKGLRVHLLAYSRQSLSSVK